MKAETANEYNPWAYFPIHLSPEEIERPQSVIAAFFDDDRLPGQLAMLKAWREFVLKSDYYRGPKNSPSDLVYFYKLNIALIEALYLLHQSSAAGSTPGGPNLSGTELAKEKKNWTAYPVLLSTAELTDPSLFLQGFFAAYSLPQYREQLAEWLEHGLSSRPAAEFISTVDLIMVYENLQKLYEAAWVIHQRVSTRPYLILQNEKEDNDRKNNCNIINCSCDILPKDKKHPNNSNYNNSHNLAPKAVVPEQQAVPRADVTLYALNTDTGLLAAGLLSQVVSIIKHKVPSVQVVVYLGTPPVKQSPLFLLILTDDNEREQAHTLSATIEQSCRELTSVVALVHHASSLFAAIGHDNLFFSNVLSCPVIYLSGELLLPAAKLVQTTIITTGNSNVLWQRWQRQGLDFLDGAAFHLEKGAANAALFCLHQCLECMLIAIIRAVTGYRINNHNLSKLLSLTRMFTADLAQVFSVDDFQNKKLFDLLKHAYVNVRYKDDFEVELLSVQALYPLVQRFATVTKQVYQKHLLMNSL